MASFSSSAFSTSAFSVNAFDFGGVIPPVPPVVPRGGDGWYKRKKPVVPDRRVENETKERLEFDRVISDIYDKVHNLQPEQREEVEEILEVKLPKKLSKKTSVNMPELDIERILSDSNSLRRLIELRNLAMQEEEAAIAFLMMTI